MARRLFGLDVGTSAVTIAGVVPGDPPTLEAFGQVALPPGTMREGEVADAAALTEAVARLRDEVGVKKATVRLGVSSPRVVVRRIEMPVMTRDEVAGALDFQAADFIPFRLDEAVLDFAILGPVERGDPGGTDAAATMDVLVAAVPESVVVPIVAAVEAGGLQVGAVDLVPLALVRAIRPRVPALVGGEGGEDEPGGAEAIVSFGGGVTSVVVQQAGEPRFVRVVGGGGTALTEAVAESLGVPEQTAEAMKRTLGEALDEEWATPTLSALATPVAALLEDVRNSISFFRHQPDALRIERIVAVGGTACLPGLTDRLTTLVGIPVESVALDDVCRIGQIGFDADEIPMLAPFVPAAVGLALGAAGRGAVVDLLPGARKGAVRKRGVGPKVAIAAGLVVLLLGGLTFAKRMQVSSARADQRAAEAESTRLRTELTRLLAEAATGGTTAQIGATVTSLLGDDVGWTRMLDDIGVALPAGTWLTSFQAQRPIAGAIGAPLAGTPVAEAPATGAGTAAVPSTPLTGSAACAAVQRPILGDVTMSGIARDVPTLAAFLDALERSGGAPTPLVRDVWLTSAQKSTFGTSEMVAFSIGAALGEGARSARLQSFFEEALCR